MRRVITLAAAFVLAGCGSTSAASSSPSSTPTPSPSTRIIAGYLTVPISARSANQLIDAGTVSEGTLPCAPRAGYDDIHAGAQVTVTDESGKVLAIGQLKESGLEAADTSDNVVDANCRYDFEVDAPVGATFYGIEVAHRGIVRFTPDDVVQRVHLTLGS